MGLIVGLCLILICLSCFIMFMNISMKLKDRFYQLVAFGLGVLYIFQIFLTIGGDTKFIPLTGVTLPLVSYGGSSMLLQVIPHNMVSFLLRHDGSRQIIHHADSDQFLFLQQFTQPPV